MLDFQTWPDRYKARTTHGTLDELVEAGERLARGLPFSPELDDALTYGSAVGGARPKALLVDGDRELIAKFSVSTDTFPRVQAEAIAMELARRCGVITAATTLTSVKTLKLPETRLRFDVPAATLCRLFRRFVVSILVGNTDDHPRNHAAFWDGRILTLTPAFDICPQPVLRVRPRR